MAKATSARHQAIGNRTKHSPHAIILVQRCALGHSATTDPPGAAANIAAASRQRERAVTVKPSRFAFSITGGM